MAQTTIIVAELSSKNGWINVKSNEGKEISVKEDKAPKTAAALKNASQGSEVTGNLVEKDGKYYMWDLDEKKGSGGGKTFAPKDKSFEAAQTAITAAASMYSLEKDKDIAKILSAAESFHAFLMSKATKPTESK